MASKTKRRKRRERNPGDLHTIPTFCEANHISPATYFVLKRNGHGPREIKIGKRVLITPEAEADWRREREQYPLEKK